MRAIILDKSTYFFNDPIIAPDGGNALMLYSLDDGTIITQLTAYDPGYNLNSFGITIGNYSVIEITTSDSYCYAYQETLDECKASPEFLSEFLFKVVPPPEVGGGGGDELPPDGASFSKSTVSISSPKDGDTLSYKGIIDYFTLNASKVSLYYSNKLAEWGGAFVGTDDKVSIEDGAPMTGPYSWSTKGLTVGDFYRVVVEALGLNGSVAQGVSGLFSLDFTAPTYIVKTDPPTTRGKDVIVSVDASESLSALPTVTVTQAGGKPVSLVMYGFGSHYEGTYAIVKGYDGIATIAVSGADRAGNVGTTTLSGGTFAVGINPPPPPHLSSPQNNLVVATSTVAVSGTARSDSEVVLTVNGVDTYTGAPNAEGKFLIPNVRLNKDARGVNVLSASARDRAGLVSAAVSAQVKYNVLPTIEVTLPKTDAIVGATTPLTVRARDENADPLALTYQILPAQNFDATQSATSTKNEWVTIGDALPPPSFQWDSTEVEDGNYVLRVIADDGVGKVYSTTTPFSIHNTLPFFRFEDGRKTVTNQSSVTVVGRVFAPTSVSPRPTLTSVEYSVDNGVKWSAVALTSGSGTSEARFSLPFKNLSTGPHTVLWRVKDSRGLSGRATHAIVVDKTAPAAPIVNYPVQNAFISNDADEDSPQEGVQISVSGTAESQSTVTLQSEGVTVSAKASVDGSFTFRSVTVPHRGVNQLKVSVKDQAGNASVATLVNVVYDNPPTLAILSPKPFRGLAATGTVAWVISDVDNDSVQGVSLAYRRGQGTFIRLPIDTAKNSFAFDVSNFPEASDYQLRLTASDGVATSTDLVGFSVDRTPPTLSSLSLDTPIVGKGGTLLAHGTATDALSGVEYVEYAIAEGEPTNFFTTLLTKGFLQANATFALRYPSALADGIYTLYARAVDAAGNVSPTLSQQVTVDTSPPHVGSFDVLAQGVRVAPDKDGVITLYKGMRALFEVSLENDTRDAFLITVGSTTTSLVKDIASGLWQATINSGSAPTTEILLRAEDDLHNILPPTPIGSLKTVDYGVVTTSLPSGESQPVEDARIKVLVLAEGTSNFVSYTTDAVTTDATGRYELSLPQGTYQLSLQTSGYHTQTQEVVLEHAGFVNVSFDAVKYKGAWGFVERMFDTIFSP